MQSLAARHDLPLPHGLYPGHSEPVLNSLPISLTKEFPFTVATESVSILEERDQMVLALFPIVVKFARTLLKTISKAIQSFS